MKMPFVIKDNIDETSKNVFDKYFFNAQDQGYILDNLWFRTQDEKNKIYSNKKTDNDLRRRVFHSMQKYNIENKDGKNNFLMDDLFIYISVSMPQNEIETYSKKIFSALNDECWNLNKNIYQKNDLIMQMNFYQNNELDRFTGFPHDYEHLEILISTKNTNFNFELENQRIWELFSKGIRNKDTSSLAQKIENIDSLKDYFPAQIETGCGPSIELGVPPLRDLHEVYKVQNKHGQFYLSESDTFLVDLIYLTDHKFSEMSNLVKEFISVGPSENHKKLNELFKLGVFKGEILSNNFDLMFSRTGLQERIVRVYEKEKFYPNINFHPEVKSLIVIGSHADRRQIWQQARKRGLKVIHINPNGYSEENDIFFEKRIEDVSKNDLLLEVTYSEWIELLYSYFEKELLLVTN